MPRLSIVIPAFGDPQRLEDTLVSVLQNRPDDCEILVVHNRPYDDPFQLRDEVRFIEAPRRSRLVACVNVGIAASRAPVVHVLACGVEVDAGWTAHALRHFREPDVAGVATLLVHHRDAKQIISAGVGYRLEGTSRRICDSAAARGTQSIDFRGPDVLAAFYRKSAVEAVGGLDAPVGDALASVDIALALARAGYRCTFEPRCVARIDPASVARFGALREGYHAERIFWRWAASHGRIASVASHVAALTGQTVIGLWRPSMLVQLLGRSVGMLSAATLPRRSLPESVAANQDLLPCTQTCDKRLDSDEYPAARAA